MCPNQIDPIFEMDLSQGLNDTEQKIFNQFKILEKETRMGCVKINIPTNGGNNTLYTIMI